MTIILKPFAMLLLWFNNLLGGYGLALLLFTLVVKVILFPFGLKGKRSMIKTTMIQGEVNKIQQQYANNKQKQQEEMQKLYEREKITPMGGCLWSLVPLIILFPLYSIIRQPMQYLMGATVDQVKSVASLLNWATAAVDHGWIKTAAEYATGGYNELFLTSLINPGNLSAVQGVVEKAQVINFNFLGINLAQVPTWKFWTNGWNWGSIGLFLMPIISVALSFLMSVVMNKTNAMNDAAAQAQGSTKMMTYLMPLVYLWFGFIMPAGMSLYFIATAVLSIVQELITGKMLKKDYEAAQVAKKERELRAKEEEKARKAALAEERARRIAEKKAQKSKKKEKPAEGEPGTDVSASRVGIRAYARGRAYDPDRYGGVTEYKDPGAPVDEAAVEEVLEKRAEAREEAELEAEINAAVEARVQAEVDAKLAGGTAEDAVEVAAEAAEEAVDAPADGDEGGKE